VVSSDPQPPARVAPTWTEPLAITASAVIGGPLGRHAMVGRSRFWTPLRVILLAAVLTLSLGWLVKAPCLQQHPGPTGRLVLDWQADRQYVAMCYTDIVTMPAEDRLTSHELPYQARWNDPTAPPGDQLRYMDYPVVTAYFLWAAAKSTMYYLSHLAGAGLPGEVLALNLEGGALGCAPSTGGGGEHPRRQKDEEAARCHSVTSLAPQRR